MYHSKYLCIYFFQVRLYLSDINQGQKISSDGFAMFSF